MHPCNHETYVYLVGDQLHYRCGKCGEVVWSYPAKTRVNWWGVGLVVGLLLIWGFLGWTACLWWGACS